MDSRKQLIKKHNDLINARYSLSVFETRIILSILTQINRFDTELSRYRIYIKDFVNLLETSSKNLYERARQVTKELMEKSLEIPTQTGFLQTTWLASVEYYWGEGYVDIEISKQLKPYLLELKGKFTTYELKYIFPLQSSYSVRIYELLKQYFSDIIERTFEIEEFKLILQIGNQYKLYADLKKRVILQAQKELREHTDIYFEFEEIKTGRKISHIKFFIFSNQKETPKEPVQKITNEQALELTKQFNSKTTEYKISEQTMLNIIKKHKVDYEKMKNNIERLPFNSSYSPIGTLIAICKDSFALPDNNINVEHKKRIEEENEKRKQEELAKEQERRKREDEAERVDNTFNSLGIIEQENLKQKAISAIKEKYFKENTNKDGLNFLLTDLMIKLKIRELIKNRELQPA